MGEFLVYRCSETPIRLFFIRYFDRDNQMKGYVCSYGWFFNRKYDVVRCVYNKATFFHTKRQVRKAIDSIIEKWKIDDGSILELYQ